MYFEKISPSLRNGYGSGYVYYNDLEEYRPDLAPLINEKAISWYNPENHLSYSQKLLAMADNERQKELNYLKDIFGVDIPYNVLEDKNFDKNLVSALNQILQSTNVLKRHIVRLKSGQAKINTTAFFKDYVYKAWNDSEIKQALVNKIHSLSFYLIQGDTNYVKTEIRNFIKDVVIKKSFELFSQTEALSHNGSKPKTSKDYRPLTPEEREEQGSLEEIMDVVNELGKKGGNPLLNYVYDLYGFDSMLDDLLKITSKDYKNKKNVRQGVNKIKVSKGVDYAKGGNLVEGIAGYMGNLLTKGLNKTIDFGDILLDMTVNSESKTYLTGSKGLKADYMFAYDIEDNLGKFFESEGHTSRKLNVDLTKKLNKFLENQEKGYVVYVNSKDYSLNKNYKGFQTGDDIKLRNLRAMYLKAGGHGPVASADFIGQIAQVIPGAIGWGNRDEVIKSIAASIADFLFDDLEIIGEDAAALNGISGNQIHLFYLSGFYVPLSVFLRQLGNAFGQVENRSVSDMVTVNLSGPSYVRYTPPYQKSYAEDTSGGNVGPWTKQKNEALDEIIIASHFWSGFDNFIKEVFE